MVKTIKEVRKKKAELAGATPEQAALEAEKPIEPKKLTEEEHEKQRAEASAFISEREKRAKAIAGGGAATRRQVGEASRSIVEESPEYKIEREREMEEARLAEEERLIKAYQNYKNKVRQTALSRESVSRLLPEGTEIEPSGEIPIEIETEEKELTPYEKFLKGTGGENIALDVFDLAASYPSLRNDLTFAARIFGTTKTFFGKNIEYRIAEAQINNMEESMSDLINYVADGGDPLVLNQMLSIYESTIVEFEASQKRRGKFNIQYWITDGKEVEQRIITAKLQLESFKRDRDRAIEEGRANRRAKMISEAKALGL